MPKWCCISFVAYTLSKAWTSLSGPLSLFSFSFFHAVVYTSNVLYGCFINASCWCCTGSCSNNHCTLTSLRVLLGLGKNLPWSPSKGWLKNLDHPQFLQCDVTHKKEELHLTVLRNMKFLHSESPIWHLVSLRVSSLCSFREFFFTSVTSDFFIRDKFKSKPISRFLGSFSETVSIRSVI